MRWEADEDYGFFALGRLAAMRFALLVASMKCSSIALG